MAAEESLICYKCLADLFQALYTLTVEAGLNHICWSVIVEAGISRPRLLILSWAAHMLVDVYPVMLLTSVYFHISEKLHFVWTDSSSDLRRYR